ncbi:MAG: Stk1 family PASTA domain-containing Ser/Thr kinase [Clostridia bacterium]|nr:Stk1 family PASTA domain-containing Ser/Thr kinase [Clostridia bacterium]
MDKYVGKRLDGRYEIKEIIGIGGMAVVYKAYDTIDDREVAVKILKDEFLANEEFRRRFKNESKAIAVMSHPNIVKVYDVSLGDRLQYIVMEHIDGITLKEYIERQKVIRWRDALHFVTQMLKALQHAHDKGIVHRDIKPQNIMLLQDGTIKVTDFGIARFSRSEHRTITDKAIGSVHYISPEQARGEITDEQSDIYSVGVLLYEMLTGRLPFDAESTVSVAIMQLQNDPVSPRSINSSIPEGLEEITLHAMQKEPAIRYQSAAEMLMDIEKFKSNPSIQFEYKYFVDKEPTKYINDSADINKTKTEKNDDEPKAPIIPILLGVATAFVIGLIVLGTVMAGKYLNWGPCSGGSGTEIECPNLVGLYYDEVKNSDEYKDFTIIEGDKRQYSAKYEAGVIMSQTPTEGKMLKGKHEITVVVSLGNKAMSMPRFTNYKAEDVKISLEQMGIEPSNITVVEAYNDEVAQGYVVATTPGEGSTINAEQKVTIYVSKGAAPIDITVGNYVGSEESEAKRKIEGEGLTLGNVTYESSSYPIGYVISQSIGSGSSAKKNDPINIVVSNGYSITVDMPIPDMAEKTFTITAFYNGSAISLTGASNIDPTVLSGSYSIKFTPTMLGLTAKDLKNAASGTTWNVWIKYSGENYVQYSFDFKTGKYSVIDQPAVLPSELLYNSTSSESGAAE